jgi:hypothetical protein
MNVTAFDLVAMKLEAVKRDMIAQLNRDIFGSFEPSPARALTPHERFVRWADELNYEDDEDY